MASQRISAAKRMATISKAGFMDYYFTRTEKNSPPRVRGKEKDLTQRAQRLEHRRHREDGPGRAVVDLIEMGRSSAAPLRGKITRLVSVRTGMSADRVTPLAVRRCRCRRLDRRGG